MLNQVATVPAAPERARVDDAAGGDTSPWTLDTRAADDDFYSRWRATELGRIVDAGLTYLDYTGAALYPGSLVRADSARLQHAVLGNPHSEHLASRDSTRDIEAARAALLDFLHASPDEYAVVLTANASDACRLVGESFPFSATRVFARAADNHNSVNGIREFARARGASVPTVGLDAELRLRDPADVLDRYADSGSLFAFPAQSNFSGVRHALSLVDRARARGWRVLLDAAAFLPTSDLDLSRYSPDFVVLSLYKISGYPAGVGALVARHEALAELQRPWFAGGTVDWVSVQQGRHRASAGAARFEDGTLPFLIAGAVPLALETVRAGDRTRLSRHLATLTAELLEGMTSLHHENATPVVRIHGPRSIHERGATVAFTVHRGDGSVVPFWEVERDAQARGIAVRGGCFCNPGCAEAAFDLGTVESCACLDSLGDAFTVPRYATCLGERPVGAVRVSLGLGSVRRDVEVLVQFLEGYRA